MQARRARPAGVWRRPLPRAQEARRWVSIPRYWVSADRRDSVRRPGGTGPIRLPIRAPPAGPLPVVAGLFTRPGPMPSLPDGRSPPRVRSAPLIGPVRVSPAGARLQLRSFDVDALPDPLAQERLDFVEPVAPIVDGQRDLVIAGAHAHRVGLQRVVSMPGRGLDGLGSGQGEPVGDQYRADLLLQLLAGEVGAMVAAGVLVHGAEDPMRTRQAMSRNGATLVPVGRSA